MTFDLDIWHAGSEVKVIAENSRWWRKNVAKVVDAAMLSGCCLIGDHAVDSFFLFQCLPPLPSNRHHRSSGDCLEDKRENYQVCSVQYCVQQLYTVNCTHIWTDLTVLLIGFCLTGPISLCLDSFLCMYYFVCDCTLHACVLCSIVTWWGGPGGIEAWSLGPLLPSVLCHCWLGHLTHKTRPRYDL